MAIMARTSKKAYHMIARTSQLLLLLLFACIFLERVCILESKLSDKYGQNPEDWNVKALNQ